MNVFTAETTGSGEIVVVHAEPGFGRDEFAEGMLEWLEDNTDEGAHTALDLFVWPDEEWAGRWLHGGAPVKGMKWPEMKEEAHFGTIRLTYMGEGESEYVLETKA